MNTIEVKRFHRLVNQLTVPENRTVPTQANLRWLMANAWIENQNDPKLYDLLHLIRPHV